MPRRRRRMSRTEGVVETVSGSEKWAASWVLGCGENEGEGVRGGVAGSRAGWRERRFGVVIL